jgi:hypothetical protein
MLNLAYQLDDSSGAIGFQRIQELTARLELCCASGTKLDIQSTWDLPHTLEAEVQYLHVVLRIDWNISTACCKRLRQGVSDRLLVVQVDARDQTLVGIRQRVMAWIGRSCDRYHGIVLYFNNL